MSLVRGYQPSPRYQDPVLRMTFARLVTHYWANAAWLPDGQLIRDASRLAGIPAVLAHGRLDVSSPWTPHGRSPTRGRAAGSPSSRTPATTPATPPSSTPSLPPPTGSPARDQRPVGPPVGARRHCLLADLRRGPGGRWPDVVPTVASERSPEARLPGGDTSVDGLALRSSVYADPELRSDRTTVRRVPDEQRVRRSARVLLVDWADRLLLVRLAAPVDGLPLWIAPGGGIEAGEDSLDAAVRELREELGIRLDPEQLTGPVWVQELDICVRPLHRDREHLPVRACRRGP